MEYYRYFDLFLSIEDELAGYMRQLKFSSKTESLYSPRISLLLLQTCPVIESYMAQLSTRSNMVKNHLLYSWEDAYSLWNSDKGKIKEKAGFRSISNFPKFAYVVEKVFGLSSMHCRFYYSERFQKIEGDAHFRDVNPFGLSSSSMILLVCAWRKAIVSRQGLTRLNGGLLITKLSMTWMKRKSLLLIRQRLRRLVRCLCSLLTVVLIIRCFKTIAS